MLLSLNQISVPTLLAISTEMIVGGGLAVIVLNTLFLRWFLGKIQSEPVDEQEVEEAPESASETTLPEPVIRTTAGVPRSRPIQPVTAPAAGVEGGGPIRLTSLAEKSPGESNPSASTAEAIEPPLSLPKTAAVGATAPISLARLAAEPAVPSPTGSLTLPPAASEPVTGAETSPASSVSALFSEPEKPAEGGEGAPPILPPMNFTKRSDRGSLAPILGGARPPGADLIITPNIPGAAGQPAKTEPLEPTPENPVRLLKPSSGAPAADLMFMDKPAPAPSVPPVETKEVAEKEVLTPKLPEPGKAAGADLIAIPTPAAEPASSDKPAATEPVTAPASGGLMLIPSSPAASAVTAESEKPASAPAAAAPTSWKTRLLGRPRIFLPTGGASTPPPESKAEATAEPPKAEADIPAPAPSHEAKVQANAPAAEAATKDDGTVKEGPTSADVTDIISAPVSSAEATIAPVETPARGKAEEKAVEPEKPAIPSIDLVPPVKEEPPAAKGEEPPAPKGEEPPAPKGEEPPTPKGEESPAPKGEESPAAEAPEPAAPKVAEAPAPKPAEAVAPMAPILAPSTEAASAPKTEKSDHVSAGKPATPITADKPPEEPAAAINLPAPIRPAQPVMNPKEPTVAAPAGGRASAQITLGFEITSLQLTPFFKLGAVQLRSLSNVVSLHLVASQAAENPLAAGISFQIESVDLDDSAHIKSILLKPLGASQALTAPQPKLQVENVKIGTGNEGAIEVTSSQQTSTAVQMLATCTIAAMDFTPSFEIGSLRLEPNSNSVMLRLAPSSRPAALDLPPSFEVANVQLEGSAQLANVRLVPSAAK